VVQIPTVFATPKIIAPFVAMVANIPVVFYIMGIIGMFYIVTMFATEIVFVITLSTNCNVSVGNHIAILMPFFAIIAKEIVFISTFFANIFPIAHFGKQINMVGSAANRTILIGFLKALFANSSSVIFVGVCVIVFGNSFSTQFANI
jgi:hypothetical protein